MRRALLVFYFVAGCAGRAEPSMPELGKVPPPRLGVDLDGVDVELAETEGRIRVVTFWADWCAPCLKEIPVLAAIQNQAGRDRLQVITVNMKQSFNAVARVKDRLAESDIIWARDRRGSTAKSFGVIGIPHMLIINPDNTLAHRHVGYSSATLPTIVSELNEMLAVNAASESAAP